MPSTSSSKKNEGMASLTSPGSSDPDEPPERVDVGVWGLRDCEVDPIGLCTEILGSESCSEAATSPGEEEPTEAEETRSDSDWRSSWDDDPMGLRRRGFPPPLTWLATGGRWSKFMRAERESGRLRITEMRAERPEIFLASREEGRLRLWLRGADRVPDLEEEEITDQREMDGGDRSGADLEEDEEEEEKGEWRREQGQVRGGEAVRRCQAAVGGGRMPLWCNNHRYISTA